MHPPRLPGKCAEGSALAAAGAGVSSQVTLVAAGPPEILPGSSGPVMQRPCFGEGGAGLAF